MVEEQLAAYLTPLGGFRTPKFGLELKRLSAMKLTQRVRPLPSLRNNNSPGPGAETPHSVTPSLTPRFDSERALHLPELTRKPLPRFQSNLHIPTLFSPMRSPNSTIRISSFSNLSQIGRRGKELKPQNQDRVLLASPMGGCGNIHLFGVFDGHGEEGHGVSQYLKEVVPGRVSALLAGLPSTSVSALVVKLTALFAQLQSEICSASFDAEMSGSTAVVTLIIDDLLLCASVGDSRAVLLRKEKWWKVKAMTRDHKPGCEGEDVRISQHQGVVRSLCDPELGPVGPLRVFAPNKAYPGLAMSRSLGDSLAHRFGVTAEPEISIHPLTSQDRCLVLGSDGLFDVVSNEEVLAVCKRYESRSDAPSCARKLVKLATSRWEEASSSMDDISVIVIYFK